MRHFPAQPGVTRTLALHCISLFLALVLVPSVAGAAVQGATLNLGTLQGSGTPDQFVNAGSFSAFFSARRNMAGSEPVNMLSWAKGEYGNPFRQTMLRPISAGEPSVAFTNSYSFSLARESSLSMNLFNGPEAGRQGLLPGVDGLLKNNFVVTLSGDNGFSRTDTVNSASWSSVWSNLKAGNYTLSISGRYGYERLYTTSGYIEQGYGGTFAISDASSGDVPLPGALLLLGSALAGGSVYGRRVLKTKKAA